MKLSEVQREFTRDIGKLIEWAYANGYELTMGDAYRSPRAFGGMGEAGPYGRAYSAHKQRLAADFNLFVDGIYRTDTKAHESLGEYWKSLNPENRWGGDFGTGEDGNHYSRKFGGIS